MQDARARHYNQRSGRWPPPVITAKRGRTLLHGFAAPGRHSDIELFECAARPPHVGSPRSLMLPYISCEEGTSLLSNSDDRTRLKGYRHPMRALICEPATNDLSRKEPDIAPWESVKLTSRIALAILNCRHLSFHPLTDGFRRASCTSAFRVRGDAGTFGGVRSAAQLICRSIRRRCTMAFL